MTARGDFDLTMQAKLFSTVLAAGLLAAGAQACHKDGTALVLAGLAAASLDLPEDT